MAGPPPKRKPGRPRDAGADRRILAAARAVAGEVGIHGVSMSAIADRSGTGKPTIYLRWPDLRSVMAAAIADLDGSVTDPPVTGCREALLAALLEDRALLVSGPESRFLRSALLESPSDDLIAEALDRRILGPRSARLRRILDLGIGDGVVRADLDTAAFADLLMAATVRAMALGAEGDGVEDTAHQAGLAVADGAPGPHPAPRAARG